MKKNKIISVIMLGLMVTSIFNSTYIPALAYTTEFITPTTPNSKYVLYPDKKDLEPVEYSEELLNSLNKVIDMVDKLEKEKNVLIPVDKDTLDIYKVSEELFKSQDIITLDDANMHKNNDQFEYIFYKLVYLSYYNIPTGQERNDFLVYLSDSMYQHSSKNMNKRQGEVFSRFYGYFLSITENELKEIDLPVRNAKNLLLYFTPGDKTENGTENSKLDENLKPSDIELIEPDKPAMPPEVDPDIDNPDQFIPSLSPDNGGNGDDFTIGDDGEFNLNGFGDMDIMGIMGYNTLTQMENNFWQSSEEFESERNSLGVFFTVNKTDLKPDYYDTMINFDNQGYVSYTDLIKVIDIVANKTEGHTVEDKDKFLAIIEEYPYLTINNDSKFHKDYVTKIFDSSKNVKIIVADPEEMKKIDEESSISAQDVKLIEVNNQNVNIKLTDKGSKLILPAKDLFDSIGVTYDKANILSKITVNKDVLSIKDNTIYINDKSTGDYIYTEDIDGVTYIELKNIISHLDYVSEFNKSSGILSLDKK